MRRRRGRFLTVLREVVSTSFFLLFVLAATYLILHYVGQRTEVIGTSMENTLSDGDNLIVDKLTYRFEEPKRFDIIVFPYHRDVNTFYIKRIIGMPGETVRIDEDGVIYINEKPLTEGYGREVILSAGLAGEPVKLKEDEYFVLGDNRNDSADSRFPEVGNIKRDEILGRAWLRIWPLSGFGWVRHQ